VQNVEGLNRRGVGVSTMVCSVYMKGCDSFNEGMQ